ncbi:MAG: DNA polymerase III subunit delta [Proteobacteria bacterium]|nr:DNA polymerase III subunit delta [Pseudomonadota bacterium]
MKVGGRQIFGFLKSPPSEVRAILFFGPDLGLVRERGGELVKVIGGDGTASGVTEMTGDAIRRDPALLADEASALSLLGDNPVVRVRDATDVIADIVESWLSAGGGNRAVVFEAGELSPRSKLRSLFEKRSDAAAIGCYADEGQGLADIVTTAVRGAGLRMTPEAMSVVMSRLGTDRMAIRQEIEKLILFHGDPAANSVISVEEAEASVGDIRASSLDDVSYAVLSGNMGEVSVSLERTFSEGVSPIAVVRAQLRLFDRLHQVQAWAKTDSVDAAVKRIKPPLHFKRSGSFAQAARRWPEADVAKALSHLLGVERDCKSGYGIDREICERALMQLAQAARRHD